VPTGVLVSPLGARCCASSSSSAPSPSPLHARTQYCPLILLASRVANACCTTHSNRASCACLFARSLVHLFVRSLVRSFVSPPPFLVCLYNYNTMYLYAMHCAPMRMMIINALVAFHQDGELRNERTIVDEERRMDGWLRSARAGAPPSAPLLLLLLLSPSSHQTNSSRVDHPTSSPLAPRWYAVGCIGCSVDLLLLPMAGAMKKARAFSLRKEAVKGSRENLHDSGTRAKIPDQLFDALVRSPSSASRRAAPPPTEPLYLWISLPRTLTQPTLCFYSLSIYHCATPSSSDPHGTRSLEIAW